MAENKKSEIVEELFFDKKGNPVKSAEEADRIVVTMRNPDGTEEVTTLVRH